MNSPNTIAQGTLAPLNWVSHLVGILESVENLPVSVLEPLSELGVSLMVLSGETHDGYLSQLLYNFRSYFSDSRLGIIADLAVDLTSLSSFIEVMQDILKCTLTCAIINSFCAPYLKV